MKLKSSPSEAPCRRMRWASSNSEFLFNSKFPRCNHCGHHVRFVLVRGPFTSTHTSTLRNNLVCGHAVQRHIVRQTYARLALPFVVCWHSVQENTSLSPVHSFLALPYATLSRRS